MQRTNQPQTTSNPTVRDAAVQISASTTVEQAKYMGLLEGVMRKNGGTRTGRALQGVPCAAALSDLGRIICDLTSAEKDRRNSGKREFRQLVKIGREAKK